MLGFGEAGELVVDAVVVDAFELGGIELEVETLAVVPRLVIELDGVDVVG